MRYPYVRGSLLQMYREAKTRLGDPVLAWADVVDDFAIVIDAVLSELGSYHRKLTGTWTSGGVENQLMLTRE